MFTNLYAATWGEVGKAKEKGFFDFDLFSWMADKGSVALDLFLVETL